MNRRNNHTRTGTGLTCILAFLFAFIFSSGSAVYAQQTQADVILPVVQKFTVKNAKDDSVNRQCSYELVALDADNPMPAGSTSGRYDFTLDGNAEQKLSLTYVHGGIYKYHLRQTTEKADNYHYDGRFYTICVYVENGQNGQLTSQVIVENEQKEKCDNLIFENSFTEKDLSGTKNPDNPKPDNPKPDNQKPENPKPDNQKPQSQKPDNRKPAENRGAVKTGDNAPLAAWISMLLLSAVGIAVILRQKRVKGND